MLQESKATRAYAEHKGKAVDDVSIVEVQNSSLGLKGWAAFYDSSKQVLGESGS